MKNKKVLKGIIFFAILILIIELLLMGIVKIMRERKIDRINMINDLIKVDDGYVTIGVSDFHNGKSVHEKIYNYNEKSNNHRIIAVQSRIAKYDNNMQLMWENTYQNTYDSIFNSVIKVDDGYIAVGSYISSDKELEENNHHALIVKFDLNGKEIWHKSYSSLSNTRFNKIIKDEDTYIVIGQSIYGKSDTDTSNIGGGIIVQYNGFGEVIAHNNYGGDRSGRFNDIIKTDDGYIVCGRDSINYGIVVKFSKDFNRESSDIDAISNKILWQRTYATTDKEGFTSMMLLDNKLYLAGSIGDIAGIVIYDENGKYISKTLSDVNGHFNSIINSNNEIYLSTNSLIIKYDIDNNKFINYKNISQTINKIINFNDKIVYIGTGNDRCNILGCDYYNLLEYLE